MVTPGGFQESSRLFRRTTIVVVASAELGSRTIAATLRVKQLLSHGVGERSAEHIADVFDRPVGKHLVAASTDGAATAALRLVEQRLCPGRSTGRSTQLVEPGADVADLEPVESFVTKTRNQVEAGEQRDISQWSSARGLVRRPRGASTPGSSRGWAWSSASGLAGPGLELDPFLVYLVVGLAVDPFAFALAVWRGHPGVCGVPVAVGEDRGFPVPAFAHVRLLVDAAADVVVHPFGEDAPVGPVLNRADLSGQDQELGLGERRSRASPRPRRSSTTCGQ